METRKERRFDGFRPKLKAWSSRPAGRAWSVILILFVLSAPAWLMSDQLSFFILFGDDIPYLSGARTARALAESLFKPHNTHVVPLFRIWTYVLAQVSGSLAAAPAVFAAGSYLGLVTAMLAVGWVVKRERGPSAVAIAAMAVVGVSTVTMPSVTWYSAGQALWAGTVVVLTVAASQSWTAKGGGVRLGLIFLGAIAAPFVWSGGHVAAPAAAAYLWVGRRPGSRQAARALLAVSAGLIVGELVAVRRELTETSIIWERHEETLPRPIQAVCHSIQAAGEALVLGNLGIDAETSILQSAVIVFVILGVWAYSLRGRRISPLEASGLVIVSASLLMVYGFRGNLPFQHLRNVRWYHAIPQLGAVLFAGGWWTAIAADRDRRRLTRAGLIGLLSLTLLLCGLHAPRSVRFLMADAPPLSDSERRRVAPIHLQAIRAVYLSQIRRDRQRAQLARLDQAERVCAARKIGAEKLRQVFGRVLMPGIPEAQKQSDVVSIMLLPRDRSNLPPAEVRALLFHLLAPEPDHRPPWLRPDDPWPPPER